MGQVPQGEPRIPPESVALYFDDVPITYTDLILVAVVSRDWIGLIRRIGQSNVAIAQPCSGLGEAVGEAVGDTVGEAAVGEAVGEEVIRFRRTHHLEAATDLRQWLAQHHVSREDLLSYARGRALHRRWGPDESHPSGWAPSMQEIQESWWREAVFGGDLDAWARQLVRWHTANRLLERENGSSTLRRGADQDTDRLGEVLRTVEQSCPRATALAITEQRVLVMLALKDGFHRWAEEAADVQAIGHYLAMKRFDWTWLSYDEVQFSAESAAREAMLCLTEDGETLDVLVARTGAVARRKALRREDLAPLADAALTALRPGEVAGPFANGAGWILFQLRSSRFPSLQDMELREAARNGVLDQKLDNAAAGRSRPVGVWQ